MSNLTPPSVICCDCRKAYPLKPTYEGGFDYKLPDGFVTVAPSIITHGTFRDPQGTVAVVEAVKQKVKTLFFCPECSTAEAHLPVEPAQPQTQRRIQADANYELQEAEPAEERPQKKARPPKDRYSMRVDEPIPEAPF